METIEQQHETAAEHNGCIGNPVTNLLMGAAAQVAAESPAADIIDLGAARAARAEPVEPGADEVPPEVLANIEAAFEELGGKVETAVRQVADTDMRTAHLVLTCERLGRDMTELQGGVARLLAHFKVA